MTKLPISIVSPVMNCIGEMPAHAEHLRVLAEVAAEIIVVDSHSSDGTKDFLQKALHDTDIRFLDHPPGLYESWNQAITTASQPFVTMGTVGDILLPESLERLYETANRFSADVVISAPTFVPIDGPRSHKRWPIHQLIERLGQTKPFALDGPSWIAANFAFYSSSLISSSASNLYRTSVLKANPFPTNLRHWGDIAWALMMGDRVKWVIDPKWNPPSFYTRTRRAGNRVFPRSSKRNGRHLPKCALSGKIGFSLWQIFLRKFLRR